MKETACNLKGELCALHLKAPKYSIVTFYVGGGLAAANTTRPQQQEVNLTHLPGGEERKRGLDQDPDAKGVTTNTQASADIGGSSNIPITGSRHVFKHLKAKINTEAPV